MPEQNEFHIFSRLPTELRLMVWELCGSNRLFLFVPDEDRDEPHSFVWTVHPRNHEIPPLLHACRESRAVWLPRFARRSGGGHQTYLYLSLRADPSPREREIPCHVRFRSPFFCYETDMFTDFYRASWEWLSAEPRMMFEASPRPSLLSFGFDDRQIRHLAWPELTTRNVVPPSTCYDIDAERMAGVQDVTIVVIDYTMRGRDDYSPGLLTRDLEDEMQLTHAICELAGEDFSIEPFSANPGAFRLHVSGPDLPPDSCEPVDIHDGLLRATLFHWIGDTVDVEDWEMLYGCWECYSRDDGYNLPRGPGHGTGCEVCDCDHTFEEARYFRPPFQIRWAALCPTAWGQNLNVWVEETGKRG